MESRSVNSVGPLENITLSGKKPSAKRKEQDPPAEPSGAPPSLCLSQAGPPPWWGLPDQEGGHRAPKGAECPSPPQWTARPGRARALCHTHPPAGARAVPAVCPARTAFRSPDQSRGCFMKGRGKENPSLKARSRTAALVGVCKQRTGWISGTPSVGGKAWGGLAGLPETPPG